MAIGFLLIRRKASHHRLFLNFVSIFRIASLYNYPSFTRGSTIAYMTSETRFPIIKRSDPR